MMRKGVAAAALWAVLQTFPAYGEVSRDNFLLQTTRDLVALCGVDGKDANAQAAIHFCHGYVLGLSHYNATVGKVFENKVYCFDGKNRPTRNEGVTMFVKWQRSHSKHGGEPPIDGVLRWLGAEFPCKK